MESNIIKPEIKDSLEIAKLIKDGWNSAYKGIISDEYLNNMDVEKIADKWKQRIENDIDNIYVYKENNQILGVIKYGKEENSYYNENMGEIYILYVKPENKRNGIGTQLLEFVKSKLIKEGYNKMIVWCLKGNVQGANFYKKMRRM